MNKPTDSSDANVSSDHQLERRGADMKVNVEIDCTPLEARQFFGLPDVSPMQVAVMEKLQQQMLANIETVTPEALMKMSLLSNTSETTTLLAAVGPRLVTVTV